MFTFPFCYTPIQEVVDESEKLIAEIDSSADLKSLFAEGKMMGILMVEDSNDKVSFLRGFSGNVGGRSRIDGFVPPIFDLSDPEGYYKKQETVISAEQDPNRKAEMSRELQDWIFDRYIVNNAIGQNVLL